MGQLVRSGPVKRALSNNLCRRTGCNMIVESVRYAVEKGNSGAAPIP
jgi:aerobic-type carbon monoxide dehydrogenase small subunit (CoxS/CutS family)